MGISHEYHSAPRRRAGRGISGKLRLAGVIVAILLVSYAVTAILEKGAAEEDSTPQTGAGGIAQNILAPLPMQGEAASGSEGTAGDSGTAQAVQLESFGPARQTDGAYTIKTCDASVIRQPACGQVDLSYFADAAFLGDSLTVGFSDYQINLGGALICGYTGVGPDAIVNRAAVKSPTRGQEVALDVLAAAQPKKLYILLGTNTLTTLGAADRFLAYYGQMLDELHGVNEQLAQLAASKGCVYLDLWEALADGEGNLKEMIAAPDGVHLSAGNGYGAWVTYLRNHAKYSAGNPWIMGSAYSAE